MSGNLEGKLLKLVYKALPLTGVIIASVLLIYHKYLQPDLSMPLTPGLFYEMVKSPLDFIRIHDLQVILDSENYLLFQNFESLPPVSLTGHNVFSALGIWLFFSLGLGLVTTLKRVPFLVSMFFIIFSLTLIRIHGLNIGGLNSNWAMAGLMLGTILPSVLIHTFFEGWKISFKLIVVSLLTFITLPLLVFFSKVNQAEILVSENIAMLAIAIAVIFILYIGHSFLAFAYLLLAKLNKGVGIKISWHLSILALLYVLLMLLLFMEITGYGIIPLPVSPVILIFVLVGIAGFFDLKRRIAQSGDNLPHPYVGEALYSIGFAISLLVFWKAVITVNTPMEDFLTHIFVYSQLSFTVLFYLYLMSNFISVMNSGKEVDRIMYKPEFFAYYHMRIGSFIAMLSLIVFTDGIVAVQFETSSTNLSADYYYAIERPNEARILYENSWQRYRRNKKALNAAAHINLYLNQPTAANSILEQSFENSPNVRDILFLAARKHHSGRLAEALYYLEKGLEIYPDDAYLLNNLALLYSKNNRGEEAFQLLDKIKGFKEMTTANKIALQVKHLIYFDMAHDPSTETIAKINQLSWYNLKGNIAPYTVKTWEIQNELVQRAAIRNQWSNQVMGKREFDLEKLDTLISKTVSPRIQEELRESRLIRNYREDYINETLKSINGMAWSFSGSSGYYHSKAAKILIRELDFEKAAVELIFAEKNGFREFTEDHLPVLYFGNQEELCVEIMRKYELTFPEWMVFEENGDLRANETVEFYAYLAQLQKQTKKEFLSALDEIKDIRLKSIFAYQILLRKSHWLDSTELPKVIAVIKDLENVDQDNLEFIEGLAEVVTTKVINKEHGNQRLKSLLDTQKDLDRNPYWTSLLFLGLENVKEDIEKYELLQQAADFNHDPLLLIQLVKYSRKLGLDNYASATLSEMAEWLSAEELAELQLKYL